MVLYLRVTFNVVFCCSFLACSQLKALNGIGPNTVIDVLSQLPTNHKWNMIGQTEIVENSQNPLFLKTVGVGYSSTPLQTRVKLLIYDVKELEAGIVSIYQK